MNEVTTALSAIQTGRTARELESPTLDFKQEGRSREDLVKEVVDACLCFANANGGSVVIGVADHVAGPAALTGTTLDADLLRRRIYDLTNPPLTVSTSLLTILGHPLVIVHVPQSPEVHADQRGRAPRRLGTDCLAMSPLEVARLREERLGIDWSAEASGRRSDAISPEAVTAMRAHLAALVDRRRELATLSLPDLLRALGVLFGSDELTKTGELLLCTPSVRDPPLIVYQFRATPGGEPRRVERLASPLISAFERVMASVEERQDTTSVVLPGGQLLSIEDFPELAVREAVSNALIHRDYRIRGDVVVEHSPSSFVVVSPGPLVSGVTPQNILTHPSKPRNPALAHAFRLLGFAEEVGRGVDRMYREMIRAGRDIPRIDNTYDSVRVTLVGGAPKASIARFAAQLPQEEREDTDTMLVLFRLCNVPTITAVNMAPILQKTPEEAEAILRRLCQDPVAMCEPTRHSSRYRSRVYRLRGEVLKSLGSAVTYHRRTLDDIDRKIIAHVVEYGKITNRTIQNLFDVGVQRAAGILSDLVEREVLVKTSLQQRGPGIEYGPGARFPQLRRRR